MHVYIECYYADGKRILGNLDGRASLRDVRDYKRTTAYKRLALIVGNPAWMKGKVAYAHVVTSDGRILEVVKPIARFAEGTDSSPVQDIAVYSAEYIENAKYYTNTKGDNHGQSSRSPTDRSFGLQETLSLPH